MDIYDRAWRPGPLASTSARVEIMTHMVKQYVVSSTPIMCKYTRGILYINRSDRVGMLLVLRSACLVNKNFQHKMSRQILRYIYEALNVDEK